MSSTNLVCLVRPAARRRFDGAGKLTSLPQVRDKESFAQVCANPK